MNWVPGVGGGAGGIGKRMICLGWLEAIDRYVLSVARVVCDGARYMGKIRGGAEAGWEAGVAEGGKRRSAIDETKKRGKVGRPSAKAFFFFFRLRFSRDLFGFFVVVVLLSLSNSCLFLSFWDVLLSFILFFLRIPSCSYVNDRAVILLWKQQYIKTRAVTL